MKSRQIDRQYRLSVQNARSYNHIIFCIIVTSVKFNEYICSQAIYRGKMEGLFDIDIQHVIIQRKSLEMPGIDPGTSRMLSERSTIWATPPSLELVFEHDI